jgi:hypothetical protein
MGERKRGEPRLIIRRGRCRKCGKTQALLPSFFLPGRLDPVRAIGVTGLAGS